MSYLSFLNSYTPRLRGIAVRQSNEVMISPLRPRTPDYNKTTMHTIYTGDLSQENRQHHMLLNSDNLSEPVQTTRQSSLQLKGNSIISHLEKCDLKRYRQLRTFPPMLFHVSRHLLTSCLSVYSHQYLLWQFVNFWRIVSYVFSVGSSREAHDLHGSQQTLTDGDLGSNNTCPRTKDHKNLSPGRIRKQEPEK